MKPHSTLTSHTFPHPKRSIPLLSLDATEKLFRAKNRLLVSLLSFITHLQGREREGRENSVSPLLQFVLFTDRSEKNKWRERAPRLHPLIVEHANIRTVRSPTLLPPCLSSALSFSSLSLTSCAALFRTPHITVILSELARA